MHTIALLKKLERYPLFTINDFAKIVNKRGPYLKTTLSRLLKRKLIQRIEKGKYSLHDDPLIFSSYVTQPSYLSLWSALRFYNLTQQQPQIHCIISAISKKKILLPNTTLFFFKGKHLFGYSKVRYSGFDIFMANPEKAIIDCLIYKLPLSYVYEALEGEINFEKLIFYAHKIGSASLCKRLGFLLQMKFKKSYSLKFKDNNYIPLDYHAPKKGKRDKKWKIIQNFNP